MLQFVTANWRRSCASDHAMDAALAPAPHAAAATLAVPNLTRLSGHCCMRKMAPLQVASRAPPVHAGNKVGRGGGGVVN